MRNRSSTRSNYYSMWKTFNEFIVKLDEKPDTWEESLTLFVGYLVRMNKKSTTIKSYISAIRAVLFENKIKLNEDAFLLTSLTRACRLVNDHVKLRLPIHILLLCLILRKLKTIFATQPYLLKFHSAILVAGYFGLLRIGELVSSLHVILAKDTQIGVNKEKIMFVLGSSKTHSEDSMPQFVKITGVERDQLMKRTHSSNQEIVAHLK